MCIELRMSTGHHVRVVGSFGGALKGELPLQQEIER